ncbi:hypothetical protein D3C85_128200 [compost metagenome]
MAQSYDVSMLGKDQVIAMLNDDYPLLKFAADKITFGEPIAATGETPVKNTELVINGVPNKGFKGTTTVFYNRIDLAEFAAVPEVAEGIILQIEGVVDIASILAKFNETFGSQLELSDLRNDHVIPPQEDILDGEDFIIYASATSFAYRGNVTVKIQPADIDIDVAITNKELNGLVFAMPA